MEAPTHQDRMVLTRISRKMHDEFPDFSRDLLKHPMKRHVFQNMLLGLIRYQDSHTLEQCVARVSSEGYTVSLETKPTAERVGYSISARDEARAQTKPVLSGSQRAKILAAYWDAGESGLTAAEAKAHAGLPDHSCYWKRVSELAQDGYVEEVLDANDAPLTRLGESGAKQRVYTITPLGLSVAAELID